MLAGSLLCFSTTGRPDNNDLADFNVVNDDCSAARALSSEKTVITVWYCNLRSAQRAL